MPFEQVADGENLVVRLSAIASSLQLERFQRTVKSASTANSVECVISRDPVEPSNRDVGNRELVAAADSIVEDVLQEILRQRSIRDHLHEELAESCLAAHEELLDIPHPGFVGGRAT